MDFDSFTFKLIGNHVSSEELKKCQEHQKNLQKQGKNTCLAQVLVEKKLLSSQQGYVLYEKYKACQQESNAKRQETSKAKTNSVLDTKAGHNTKEYIEAGNMFHHYRIENELGRGGMGAVFKAFDTKLNRYIALKIILENDDVSLVQRFMAEAKALASLEHNNIIRIFEIGAAPINYFTMEYIEGKTLHEYIKDEVFHEKKIITIFLQIAKALHKVHGLKIIHRDLKPENIMISKNDIPKIMDFGLVKITDSGLSQSTNFIGTPAYASPEQIEEKKIDVRSDIYSLGATLYEALTKRRTFEGQNAINVLYQVVNRDPIHPRTLNPDISTEIEAICLKCLEKKPHRRYSKASFLAEDLENLLLNRPIKAKPPTFTSLCWKWLQRNKTISITIATFVSIIFFLFIFFTIRLTNKQFQLQQQETLLLDKNALLLKQESELEQEKTNSREGFYPYIIALSDVYIEKNNIDLAFKLLQSEEYCPSNLREWEWDWLTAKSHNEVHSKNFKTSIFKMIEMPNKKGVALLQKYNIVIYFYDNPSKTITLETKAESLVFSKDSNFIITTEDKKLIIWDIKQKKNIKEIDVPEKITYLDINFANDIIAAHHSEYIFFISYPEGKILHKIKEKDEYLTMSSFHPKNNSIVYVGQYGKVYHFDFDQKKSYPAWEHPGKLNVCKYSPSGQYIVTAGDNHEIRIWNAKDKVLFQKLEYSKITGPRKQILLSGHTNTIYDCSFSADENLLVSCGEDSQVKLWDIKEGELKNNFHGHISSVYSCHFYTDTYIFSTGDDHRLKKWHIDKTYPKKTVFISGINDFAVNHEKNLIAIAEQNYMITVWNTELWQPEYQFISLTKPMLIEFAFIQNRLKLVIGDKVGGIKIWDIAEKKIDKEVSFSKERIDFIDIQGSKCLIGTSKMAILYSLETYDILWTQKYEYHISSVKFSPDKQTFIVARKKTCDIYDCYSYKQLKTIEIGKGRSINTANFSKDGSLLALGMSNHYINIWDMQSLQEKALLKGHEGGVLFLDFNNKGNRLISSSEDCTVRIWDIEKKSLLLTLNQHTGHVNKCVFTQDNQSILSAGEDGYFLLWTYDKHELWD